MTGEMTARLAQIGSLVGLLLAATVSAQTVTLYVAPDGNDAWSGTLAEPNAARTDGPLASAIGARDAIRKLRADGQADGPATVLLRSGVYRMEEPLVLEPPDSHVTFAAYGDESPVLSGGRVISGWTEGPDGVWSAPVPAGWVFRQLFVNGERRIRARTPNAPSGTGGLARGRPATTRIGEAGDATDPWFTVSGKAPPLIDPATGEEQPQEAQAFAFAPGEIKAWEDLNEVEVIAYHSWETSRHRIAEVDEANGIVRFTGGAVWPFERWGKGQRYFVENAPDALDAPGEWYLDRQANVVRYLPLPGENMEQAEVIAPELRRLVELRGDPEVGLYVEGVTLRGLACHHQDWDLEPEGHSDPQAVVTVPAAVMADGALGCTIENCDIAHVGEYAVWLRHGCKRNRFVHNRVTDIGTGGVRVGEASMSATDVGESSHNLIDNNHIHDLGHVYPAGVGVWVAQSSYNTISHNEIHDVNYSGLSIGWNWNDAENRCHHNLIEHNHVHHVMQGQLNDGGAIYTLGSAPGTAIRNNVFHDVWPYSAIGWGIYLDATANQHLVENNIVYNTLSGGLMYHNGGHEHIIRNNVFALTAHQALWPYFERRPNTFERNIIYFTQGELFIPYSVGSLEERLKAGESLGTWDRNVYWNPNDPDFRFHRRSFADWQALGIDEHSVIEDPQFVDVEAHDFHLKPISPALELGFEPIDTSEVGLYGEPEWVSAPKQIEHPPTQLPPLPPPPEPRAVDDGFETTVAGAAPDHAVVDGNEAGASIRVTAEQAAEGRHSLKVIDSPDVQPAWQPHLFYQPHFTKGVVRQNFDILLEPGALLFTEWRDNTAYPDCIGPSITFTGDGEVTAGGQLLAAIPVGEWVHMEVECALGQPEGAYAVTIAAPGEPPQRFEDLPLKGNEFRELHWLGFVSIATADVAFFIDNVRIGPVE